MSFNVLAVSAHFDDAELGCGGTLAKHARAGDKVYSYVATRSDYKDMSAKTVRSADVARREGVKAAKILGAELLEGAFETFHVHYDDALISELRGIVERRKIDTIYLPWTGDAHQDHRATARAAITAGRHCARLLMYRINYYDTEETFDARVYVDTTKTMPAKLKAIRAHASEHARTKGKWIESITALDRNTGIKLGVGYAEGFQAVRYLAP
jgi:LmbE family N-acetylglucosaminyl deacetylase